VVVRDSESSSYRDGRTSVKKKLLRRFVGYLSTRILSTYGIFVPAETMSNKCPC
jgi:hypothetical protein